MINYKNMTSSTSLLTSEIQFLENYFKPLHGLPTCYADDEEQYEIYIPIIRQLNRGVVVLCGFKVDEEDADNVILIEIDNKQKSVFYELLRILQPVTVLLWNFNKVDVTNWGIAVKESGIPTICIDFLACTISLGELCMSINQKLWEVEIGENSSLLGLNIGCGTRPLSGWMNVDIKPKYPHVKFMDASLSFPYPNEAYRYVLSEHMFEHLPFKTGLHMLKEVYRILEDNGIFILSVPTLDFLIQLYSNSDSELHQRYVQWSISQFDPEVSQFYSNKKIPSMFILNNFMRFWNHQMIYDIKTLTDLLYRIGFRSVKCMEVGKFHLEGCILEQHGYVIPDWANKLEAMTFIAYK